MNKRIADVHSLLLPVEDDQLLLPNAAVAEIIEYRAPTTVADAPTWLLGNVSWRGLDIPLVSYEAFTGGEPPADASRLRIAVLNTLNGSRSLAFIGVVLRGIPRLLNANADNTVGDGGGNDVEGRLAQVQANGEKAAIPDLDALERSIVDCRAG